MAKDDTPMLCMRWSCARPLNCANRHADRWARGARTILLGSILLGATVAASAADCEAQRGEQAFGKCSACHSLDAGNHLMGPSLNRLKGRPAGTVAGFSFSSALHDSGVVWGPDTLDAFLAGPQTLIPGTAMPFSGIRNGAERAALVCYLLSE